MKDAPKLSIITICFNIKDEIERTCQSIVSQTWQNFEWIVIDGGSTDGTLDVLKKYQKRIDILVSEKDKGIYNAMNKGIMLAHGKWLNFMNGGDCFADCNVLMNVFDGKQYKSDVLYGKTSLCLNGKEQELRNYPKPMNKLWLFFNTIGHQSSFIQRKLFDKYGLYDENFRIGGDVEKWIVFANHKCSFEDIDYVVSKFDMSGISSLHTERQKEERTYIWNKYFKNVRYYRLLGIPLLSVEWK